MILDIAQKNNPGPMMEPFHYVFFQCMCILCLLSMWSLQFGDVVLPPSPPLGARD